MREFMNTRNNGSWIHFFNEGENKRTFANIIAKDKAADADLTHYPVATQLFLSDTDMLKDAHISIENARSILSRFVGGELKLETKLVDYLKLSLFHYYALPTSERCKLANKGYSLVGHVMVMIENIISLTLQIEKVIKILQKDTGLRSEVLQEFLFTMNRTYPDLISLQRKLYDLWQFVFKEYQQRAEKAI